MLRILCRVGIQISHNEFQAAWEKAKEMDPDGKGRVSFQTFREAMHKVLCSVPYVCAKSILENVILT
jgi:hypothetical protein